MPSYDSSTLLGISHRVRGVPDWNHQAFADDLSLYVDSTDDANTLLDIVSEFQEWSCLKISIKKSLATGALYSRCETQRQKEASAGSRKRKAPGLQQFISKVVLQKTQDLENLTDDTQSDDEDVATACDELTRRSLSGMLSVRRAVVIVCELWQGLVVFFIDFLFLREQSP